MDKYLRFEGIGKSFPGVTALKDISFEAKGGKILALLGENGAGKSTLLKILSGDLRQDEGNVIINGEVMSFSSPHQAIKSGVSVISQERQLIPALSVMENLFLGNQPTNKIGTLNIKKLKKLSQDTIDAFGLPIKATDIVGRLSVAYQQMIEIMKAYVRDSDIIAFDEPTAPLADAEIKILFQIINQLKERGKIILYVSHRMAELFMLSDEIVILKDGRFVEVVKTSETTEKHLIGAMVGRDIGDTYNNLDRNDNIGEELLTIKNLTTEYVSDVSLTLHKGEVIGLAGLVGAGRTEVVRAIFGLDKVKSGEILIDGKPIKIRSPKDAIKAGIAFCPEDRKEQGLLLLRSIRENVSIPVVKKLRKGLFIDSEAEAELANKAVERYAIKTPNIEKIAAELSGGNQQKVILGRCTSEKIDTRILILDEPTKGIDVGAKAEIYQMICNFAKAGIGVIFISSELTEVINIADSISVMCGGCITGVVKREDATEKNVLALAMVE